MFALPLTPAAASLLLAGLLNLWAAALIDLSRFWRQAGGMVPESGRAGQIAYQTALWNGFLLLFVAFAIDRTAFSPQTNFQLALLQVIGASISTLRSLYAFWRGYDDLFVLESQLLMRSLGLGHIFDLLALAGILFGVARALLIG